MRPVGLQGSLFSTTECCVDPREAIQKIPRFLAEKHGVSLHFGKVVVSVEEKIVRTSDGKQLEAERILICSGSDFHTLFPEQFADTPIRRCKLQMLRTVPQPNGWRLGPHIAGGLTLCHYAAFAACPSLPKLRQRYEQSMAEYLRYGIHVMASQNQLGEVVIGDSHEYDQDIELFDKPIIDDLILAYLSRMLRLPELSIQARWHGIYTKHPTESIHTAEPQPGVFLRVAPGGAGMTMSFGLAEAFFEADRTG